jgi:hypothetical protein
MEKYEGVTTAPFCAGTASFTWANNPGHASIKRRDRETRRIRIQASYPDILPGTPVLLDSQSRFPLDSIPFLNKFQFTDRVQVMKKPGIMNNA